MKKLLLTTILTAVAAVMTVVPAAGRERGARQRVHTAAADARPVAEQYPLLKRVIHTEQPATMLSARPTSAAPVVRPATAVRRSAAPVQMMGNVVYASDWDSRYEGYGLYDINVAGGNITTDLKLKGTSTAPNSNAGGVLAGDLFFSTYWYEGWGMIMLDLTVYNTATWEKIGTYWLEPYEGEIGYIASDMAYDAATGTIYGCFYNNSGTGYEIGTIEYFTYENEYYDETWYDARKTSLGAISNRVVALGVTADGRLYGVEEDGCFYEFDTATGAERLIGDTGVKIASSQGVRPQSGAIDSQTGTFYWASVDMNGNSVLYTVDREDGHVERVGDMPAQERVYGLTVMPHAAADDAPNYLTDFAVTFEGASLSGTVAFTLPADTYAGTAIAGDLSWHVLANGVEKAQGTAAAGTAVETTITVDGGMVNIEAYAENAGGKSPYSAVELWVGEDYPVVRKADFSYVNNVATVSWAVEPLGAHGGTVSAVTFDVVRMPGEVTVAEGTTATTFSETLTNDMPLGNYYYVITPANHGLTGEPMETSSRVIIGQSIVPPYLETFDTRESLDLYTIIGKEWSWNTRTSSSTNGVVNCSKSNSSSDDDEVGGPTGSTGDRSSSWLITPEIQVEAGKTYEVRLKSWAVYGDKFEVWYGPGLDPAKYSILMPATAGFGSSSYEEEHVMQFTAEKTENIHLGFVHAGMYDSFLRLDDISISAGRGTASPAAITDLEVAPVAPGSKSVTISFTAPAEDAQGNALTSLEKIDILVGTDVVKTFEAATPGQKYSYKYTAPDNGYYLIRVESYNDGCKSEAAEAKVFVGVDVPKAPTATIADKGDYIEVQWTIDETGENDGYVDPDGVYYALFQMDGSGCVDIDNPVAENLQGSSVAFDFNPNEGPQGLLQLVICAYNTAGVSGFRYTSALLVGEPYELPFDDGFDEYAGHPWLVSTYSDTFGVSTSHFSDADGYSWGWAVLESDPTSDLESGKIAAGGAEGNLSVTFDYIANSGNAIDVYALYPDGSEALVGTAAEESTGNNDDWKSAAFEIPGSAEGRYIRLRFTFRNEAGFGAFMHLDNIHCDIAIDHDVRVEASLMKGQAKVGETAVIAARATNLGQLPAEGAELSLYVDGKLAETKAVKTLAPQECETIYFNYVLTPATTGKVRFQVEAAYAPDQRRENNKALVVLHVAEPTAPAPVNLQGETTDNGVKLSWEAPEEFSVDTVVEDFESYETFSIDDLGEWTMVDADGRTTMTLAGLSYPNNGARMAYMVFDPSKVVLPDETVGLPAGNTEARAYDGSQYLIAVATVLDQPDDHNDDWLISPELSGNAQTLSFFAKPMVDYYGAESCEVLYATENTTDIADFTLLESFEVENPAAWTELQTELPEGAKRFAIRVTTARGYIFMLDHITYEKGTTRVVTGYNVYRDEQKIATTGFSELGYEDTDAPGGSTYAVTAVFASGEESGYSNTYSAESGLTDIVADRTYTVVGINGIVYQTSGRELMALPAGIYIINGKRTIIK